MKNKRIPLLISTIILGVINVFTSMKLFSIPEGERVSFISVFIWLFLLMAFMLAFLLFLASFKKIDIFMTNIDMKVKQIYKIKNDKQKITYAFLWLLAGIIFISISMYLNEGTIAFLTLLIAVFSVGICISFIVTSNTKIKEYFLALIKELF